MKLEQRDINLFLGGVFIASITMMLFDMAPFIFATVLFAYFIAIFALNYKRKREKPKLQIKPTKEQKALQKLKNKRAKEAQRKHDLLNNQFAYIASIWELTKTQEKAFTRFIEKRSYGNIYSKLSSSLLPQLTKMIEECLERDKKGCKRDVNRAINELVALIKSESKKGVKEKKESFETMSDVFDQLMRELK